MKKFFSLVLALVMALSLTTVAWGADPATCAHSSPTTATLNHVSVQYCADCEAYIVSDTDSYADALVSGQNLTVILKAGDYGTINVTPTHAVPENLTIIAEDGVTVETMNLRGVNITLSNITFDGTVEDTSGLQLVFADTLTVDGCHFVNEATITGRNAYSDILIKNCTFDNSNAAAASNNSAIVLSGTTVNNSHTPPTSYIQGFVKIQNNAFKNSMYNAIQITGIVDADVEISGNIINGTKDRALRLENIQDDATVTISNNKISNCAVATNKGLIAVTSVAGTGAVSFSGNTYANVAWNPATITNTTSAVAYKPSVAQVGTTTYDTVAAAIAAANGAPVILLDDSATIPTDYTTLLDTNGNTVVVPTVTKGDKFDLYLADSGMKDALAAGAEDVSGLSFTDMPAKANADGSGNLAYIAANNGEYYVKTTNPTVADYAVTVSGKTAVLYYVSVVDVADVTYAATAKAFTNFGIKCGQLYQVDKTLTYYEVVKADATTTWLAGDVLVEVDPDTFVGAMTNVLVGNEVVVVASAKVAESKTLAADKLVAHRWAVTGVTYSASLGNVPTEAKCLNCGAVVTDFYYGAGKVPAGKLGVALPAPYASWYIVEPAAAATGGSPVVVTPSKPVQSADTFDAGIAMYVGMSIMAAAGGAVVIGKKKD